ncbi:MAG: glucose-1-phosphate adenylyltransferase subunit GlgD [Clostridia bacterium]|nr:glucose-1-phosphate adenylyltransferase subunit GlgD [Clostridia bacterium]
MKDIMGLIYTGENDARLRELTQVRAVAALPVAGRYRVIDFPVSSMVNTGIRNVGVITQKNYHSLMDHLGSGKEWDLHGKNNRLAILPPFLTRENIGVYNGLVDALQSNANYLHRCRQEYIILTTSHFIINTDFRDMMRFHAEKDADVTLLYTNDPAMRRVTQGSESTFFTTDSNGRIVGMEIDPTTPTREHTVIEVCLLKRELLLHLVDQAAANGQHEFMRGVLQPLINDGSLHVHGYEHKGRVWRIQSVQDYFQFNMDLLDSRVRGELFSRGYPVYTKLRDDMPTRYVGEAAVTNSLVADGCVIEGKVINSVVFRGVRIAKGAAVRNSVVMQDAEVEADAELDCCILDKQAVIRSKGRLIGPPAYPIVIAKGVVI